MKSARNILYLTTFFFLSCTLFKKDLSKPVTIVFDKGSNSANFSDAGITTKYLNLVTPEQIENAFMESFKTEASCTNHVSLTESADNADFLLKLVSLNVRESSKTEKISDSNSPYNGQEVLLNSVECSAEFELINLKDKTKTPVRCFNSKIRTEKVKNNRTISDLILGSNKDHSQYHTKLLSDNICTHLAQDVGRRIWTPITRKIAKNL